MEKKRSNPEWNEIIAGSSRLPRSSLWPSGIGREEIQNLKGLRREGKNSFSLVRGKKGLYRATIAGKEVRTLANRKKVRRGYSSQRKRLNQALPIHEGYYEGGVPPPQPNRGELVSEKKLFPLMQERKGTKQPRNCRRERGNSWIHHQLSEDKQHRWSRMEKMGKERTIFAQPGPKGKAEGEKNAAPGFRGGMPPIKGW